MELTLQVLKEVTGVEYCLSSKNVKEDFKRQTGVKDSLDISNMEIGFKTIQMLGIEYNKKKYAEQQEYPVTFNLEKQRGLLDEWQIEPIELKRYLNFKIINSLSSDSKEVLKNRFNYTLENNNVNKDNWRKIFHAIGKDTSMIKGIFGW